MLHNVALVRTDVSEELSASFIKVTNIGELGTLAVNSNNTRCQEIPNTKYLVFGISCHLNEGGANFLRNVGSYKSHTA
jgi:hypothetical protein